MDSANERYIAEIKAAIQNGTLTGVDIHRRLMHAIENEMKKDDEAADMAFVQASHALLRKIHGVDFVVDKYKMQESLHLSQSKLRAKMRRRSLLRTTKRVALSTVAVFVLMLIADGVFHWEWLGGKSTDDQQQYVITGQVIEPGMVEKGNADDEAVQPNEITTTDLDEAIAVLGFTPPMPTWFPEGWNVANYYAYSDDYSQIFAISLRSQDNDKMLNYEIKHFLSIADAVATFEQNELGVSTQVNDWSVYFSQNIERSAAIWYENYICYSLYGSTTEDELCRIIQSINKE